RDLDVALVVPPRHASLLSPGEVRLEVRGPDEILDVQERRALLADVDERRLHPRQHARDLAEVDVADETLLPFSLDVQLGEDPVLDQRDARLTEIAVDDQCVLSHDQISFDGAAAPSGRGVSITSVTGPSFKLETF